MFTKTARYRTHLLRWLIGVPLLLIALLIGGAGSDTQAQATQTGLVNVIVTLKVPTLTLDSHASFAQNRTAVRAFQPVIRQARNALLADLAGYHAIVYAGQDWFIPGIALRVDKAALDHLNHSPLVASVSPDHALHVADAASDTLIGAQNVWNLGYAGSNQAVAILDTGVQENHPFLGGRVVAEACFSGGSNTANSLCPNGQVSQTGAGAGVNCSGLTSCEHGTHVAGIAAGNGFGGGGIGYGGVAISSNIIAVQVFSNNGVGGTTAFDSDIISGLNWVYGIRASFSIAAVNLSLGDGLLHTSSCDSANSSMTSAFNTLRGTGIAVVVAAGNNGFITGLNYPACISSAISVGAVDNSDGVPSFSNRGPQMTIYAPGSSVSSSLPGSTYGQLSGTSMAAPHVAGALAVLRSYNPTATVDQLQLLIYKTGKLIYSADSGLSQPRLQLDQAVAVGAANLRTIGTYRNNTFLLRNANATGYADAYISYGFGSSNYPIVGDWTGTGVDRVGVYVQSNGLFILCIADANPTCNGTPGGSQLQMVLGNPGDYPIAAFWHPVAHYSGATLTTYANEGVGVFRPTNGLIYLRDTLTTGYADETMVLGIPGDIGIAGDWNGDGQGSPGVYRPSNGVFYLSNQVTNGSVYGDVQFTFGDGYNDIPVAGNWTGRPNHYGLGVGTYRTGTGYFLLRNTLNTGYADISFSFGIASDLPVAGAWGSLTGPIAPRGLKTPPTILVPQQTPAPSNVIPGGNVIGD